ncbi:Undecaprenyl-phosphate galactose phosphotransferase WbaP/exopolysaccharide biosynthesis polyprenyl glycosylphosphotransferase [Kribbella jejuensis]|uniref:Undecaprenyl-phosphate galactose phosphotransferase WbaP/exopolysaccharide biosynthesis polyprenyl glycosylphosphotransferase n=2 Tax=Kribbella jejuensis TaxID=236068 RepID=A0A542DAT5_9ACTN|nr:Undecaprenyl-phosphate galactose phosphotransferase WbaP/exopolysaccharide biosynthesis polyprenyl glycosylphosphotransferase [Kribbella jejuensis]
MSEGLADPADLRPAPSGERRRPVWVVPDEVPAIVPRSARSTEARWVAKYRWAALAGDLGAALFGVSLALLVRFGAQIDLGYVLLGAALPVAWLVCVALERGYETRYFGTGPEEFRSIIRAAVALTAVVAVTSYATKSQVARGFVVLAVPMTCLAAMFARWLLHRQISKRRFLNRCMRQVLVVGRNDQVTTLRRHLEERKTDGYVVVASCLPRGDAFEEPEPERLGRAEMDILKAVDEWEVDVVAVAADPELTGHSLRKLSWALEQRGVELIVSPGIVEVAGPRISIRPVAGLSLLHLERPSVSGGPHVLKNVFDRVVGCLMLLALAPLLLVTAIVVKLTSRGPVLFKQTRVGRGGEQFKMLKFRTMVVDAEERKAELHALNEGNGILFKLRDDPRITKVGKYLRRFSIDELPQLVNVLRGDMSLVGPRPPLPAEVAQYQIDDARRMLVKPGLTGLWQVSGRSDLTWEESMRLDLRYADNWSIALDLLILWKTARAVLGSDGAY